jgi:hypothetical protein
MHLGPDIRKDQRLRLRYPIRVETRTDASSGVVLTRTVTRDVGARGAYFFTFEGGEYSAGQDVAVTVSVPHRLAVGGPEVMLDLVGDARVVRVESAADHRRYGEDGRELRGVALRFNGSLSFQYRWV